jgi:hypothetical protein
MELSHEFEVIHYIAINMSKILHAVLLLNRQAEKWAIHHQECLAVCNKTSYH